MRNKAVFIAVWGILLLVPCVDAQDQRDTLRTSLSLNSSFGGLMASGENFGFTQRINPSYNLLYRKCELGLGLDYYQSVYRRDEYFKNVGYLGFSPYLRRYLGAREFFFVETYLNTGYYWSMGKTSGGPEGFQTSLGFGLGVKFHPYMLDKYAFWRHVDFNVYLRQNLINRSNPMGNTDMRIGLVYRFY